MPPGVLFGDYAVHTIQPHLQPYSPTSTLSQRLPMLHIPNIGDELTAKGVSWAWYSGRWDNAAGITTGPGWTNGITHRTCTDPNRNPADTYPYCADKLFRYLARRAGAHLQDVSRSKIGSGSWPAVSSWRQAARLYSLISPFSMDFRRIRWTSRLTAVTPGASHS